LDDGVTAIATDVERLVVSLEASAKKFENAMNRAVGVTNNSISRVERRTAQATQRINQTFSRMGTTLKASMAGIFAGLSVQQVSQFADSFTKVQNALKVAGLEGRELARIYEQIFAISQRQAAPLEAMATLYGRLSTAQNELNVSGTEMLRFTELVGMALRAQGTSAQEASGALLQLSQALGGGKIQAEEYNSLLDGARPLLQAVAAGMAEAGGSVAKLTALVKDGKVSSEAFFRAALAGYPLLEKQSASAGLTMAQSMGKAQDALTNLVGKLDQALTASNKASGGMNGFTEAINGIANAVPGAMAQLDSLYEKMANIGNSDIFRRLNEGLESIGLSGMNGVEKLNRFDQVFGAKGNAGSMAGYKPGAQTSPAATPAITPIRNADYAVPGTEKGGGKSSRDRINEYQREIEAIQQRTRALDAEQQTIGLSAGETAKAEAAFRLLEAAKEANVEVTPALRAQIDKLAAAYGEATQKVEEAQAAQEAVAEAAREFGQTLSGAFSDAIFEGEKLDEIGRRLAKTFGARALDNLFGLLFGGTGRAGGGLLDGLLKAFIPGKAGGGMVNAMQPYEVGENGRELFVPTTPGRIVPHGKYGGGAMQVVVNNNAGAQVSTRQVQGPRGPRLEVQIEQMLGGMVANGGLDKALKQRFGVNPMGGR
jgi:tape measure domain-containing protein